MFIRVIYGPCFRDRNQWSFDMFFVQESFKNALFLMILVCMDRAQSEELGTLYFCMCQMYISSKKFTLKLKKWQK